MKELVKYVMPIATKRINLHTRAHVPRRTELAVFVRKLEVSDDTPTYQPMIRIHLLFLIKRLDFFQRLLQKKHFK